MQDGWWFVFFQELLSVVIMNRREDKCLKIYSGPHRLFLKRHVWCYSADSFWSSSITNPYQCSQSVTRNAGTLFEPLGFVPPQQDIVSLLDLQEHLLSIFAGIVVWMPYFGQLPVASSYLFNRCFCLQWQHLQFKTDRSNRAMSTKWNVTYVWTCSPAAPLFLSACTLSAMFPRPFSKPLLGTLHR